MSKQKIRLKNKHKVSLRRYKGIDLEYIINSIASAFQIPKAMLMGKKS